MSMLYKHPLPINSDESNSTEHDATVSLSGTDEFNDTHSVFSDTGSKASKLNESRKTIHRLNKLKEENAILKESLEKANATDITMLKSKLRGSHADLVRMRQNNSELKDRIQILEGRLFSALSTTSMNNTNKNVVNAETINDVSNDNLPPHFTEPSQKDRFTSGDRAHLMDMIRSLQSRCKHLARLVQSYETKISVLQSESDMKTPMPHAHNAHIEFELSPPHEVHEVHTDRTNTATLEWTSNPLKSALKAHSTSHTTSGNPATAHDIPTSANTNSNATTNTTNTNTSKRVKITPNDLDSRIQQARAEDLKMVRELSNEVRRLVALLPRDKIDPDDTPESDSEGGEDVNSRIGAVNGDKTHTSNKNRESSAIKSVVETQNIVTNQIHNKMQYTHSDVLCSFFIGVILMLLSVTLSTYITNQVKVLEPEQPL